MGQSDPWASVSHLYSCEEMHSLSPHILCKICPSAFQTCDLRDL